MQHSDQSKSDEPKPAVYCPELRAGLYRHYKGNMYQVLHVANHSETREPLVVYRALYGEYGVWVRPYTMFIEDVIIDGKARPRFAFVEE